MNSNFTLLTVVVTWGAAVGKLEGTAEGASVSLTLGIVDGDVLGASVAAEGLVLGEAEDRFQKKKKKASAYIRIE